MNEKLQKWSLIAEIVGGLGVIITLVILIIEVRENSELTRVSAYQQDIQNFNEWRSTIVSDPNQVRLFAAWNRGEGIPARRTEDGMVLGFILDGLFTNYESSFYSREAEVLGDPEWERVARATCNAYQLAADREEYWRSISIRLTDPFVSFMESNCSGS